MLQITTLPACSFYFVISLEAQSGDKAALPLGTAPLAFR